MIRLLGAAVLVVIAATTAAAQTATAPALTAAFLYNFAKFTEWPAESLPQGAPLVLCVAEDDGVQKALADATRGREIDGHRLDARGMDFAGPVTTCHVLYVGNTDGERIIQLLERLKGAATLSVGRFDRFTELGGSANLFVEGGKMRFAVNLESAQRSRLRLSSQLLKLAKIVKDNPNVAQR